MFLWERRLVSRDRRLFIELAFLGGVGVEFRIEDFGCVGSRGLKIVSLGVCAA